VGLRTVVNKETQRLMQVVTRVPVTTGASLRRLLQVRAVRYVQKELGHYFNNNLVLFLSGMRNYDMAVALSDYTKNLSFADAVFQTGFAGACWVRWSNLSSSPRASELDALDGVPGEILESVLSGTLKNKIAWPMRGGQVACHRGHLPPNSRRSAMAKQPGRQDPDHLGRGRRANCLFRQVQGEPGGGRHAQALRPRWWASAPFTAMILAATGEGRGRSSTDHDFEEILHELDIKPRLLHPTRHFRNIRRFAFVIHPLSQNYIRNAFPIPKSTPKFVMDKVETLAAHMPPMVYCKMENIISPTGAEAEGWLISVGGTPKEMLSRSPEFTYRRLLHAAKIAEKMGAQIMGLGAFTKVVGDAGVTVAKRASIPITTGNSYSASGALWAAADAMRRMGLVKIDPVTKKVAAKTMVIGASGSIGSVSARLLAMAFDEVYIAGRTLSKLEALRDSILEETPDAKVTATTDYNELLGDMDMIVTSTSGAPARKSWTSCG
jgi:hypothetical protein